MLSADSPKAHIQSGSRACLMTSVMENKG